MPTFSKDLARDLLADHAGIENLTVAQELWDSFLKVVKNKIVREGECNLDGIGKLYIKKYKGSRKYNPTTGGRYETSPRNVVKIQASVSMTKLVNVVVPKSS